MGKTTILFYTKKNLDATGLKWCNKDYKEPQQTNLNQEGNEMIDFVNLVGNVIFLLIFILVVLSASCGLLWVLDMEKLGPK